MAAPSVCHGHAVFYPPGQTFVIRDKTSNLQWPLDSRALAYWADGSLKWTAHSVNGRIEYWPDGYAVQGAPHQEEFENFVKVVNQGPSLLVTSSMGLQLKFAAPGGSSFLEDLSLDGKTVCTAAAVVASINAVKCRRVSRRLKPKMWPSATKPSGRARLWG